MKTNTRSIIKSTLGIGIVVGALALTSSSIAATSGASGAPEADARVEAPVSKSAEDAAIKRSHEVRVALGMPTGKSHARHVKDGPRQVEYDEVTDVDQTGSDISMTEVDASGRLLLAVRFDFPKGSDKGLDSNGAARKASAGLKAAGIEPQGQPAIDRLASAGGWDVRWARTMNGVAVRGDEIRVHLRDDGVIGSVGHVSHELAPEPATRLDAGQARDAALAEVRAWSSRSGAHFSVGDPELQWAPPNAAFDPARIGAAEEPYRLCWIVRVEPQGDAASVVREVVLFLDAADGSVIGGDVVE